jgi:hypothetical protein
MAEIAEQIARAFMDEQQQVAIGIARTRCGIGLLARPDPIRQLAFESSSAPRETARSPSAAASASKARGRSGPSNDVQPVGGCL